MLSSERLRSLKACWSVVSLWIIVEARFPNVIQNTNVSKEQCRIFLFNSALQNPVLWGGLFSDKRFTASFCLFFFFFSSRCLRGGICTCGRTFIQVCIPTCRMKVECASLCIPLMFKADLSKFFLTCWCDECALPVPQTVSQSEKRAVDAIQIPSKTMCYCHWLQHTASVLDIVVNTEVNFGWLHRGQAQSCLVTFAFFSSFIHSFFLHSICLCYVKICTASVSNAFNQIPF